MGVLRITFSGVQVSLYSMNAETHDSITKLPGSFVKTKVAILKLIEHDIPLQISRTMARYDHTTGNFDNRFSIDEVGKVIVDIKHDPDYEERLIEADFAEADFVNKIILYSFKLVYCTWNCIIPCTINYYNRK